MFTGIIEDLGIVKSIKRQQNYKLTVESLIFKDQKIGNSISVNGVCLTISDLRQNLASFDVMVETVKKTDLGSLKIGDKVNLERALKFGDRLGGHFVTGHIDCVGKIIDINSQKIKVKIKKEDMKFIVPKGSISLDGISLTIAEIGEDDFKVYLIPHTIKNTNLGFKKIGDSLNIEFDLIGKYGLNLYDKKIEKSAITEEFLRKKGFC